MNKFKMFMADICIKIFQILFAMLVVGVVLRDTFNLSVFLVGIALSLIALTGGIFTYYDSTIRGGDRK